MTVESVGFTITGTPIPKGRPRFYNGVAITPKTTRAYEALVSEIASLRCRHWRRDGLYRVTLDFMADRTLRGDIDNYAKAILDGIQGAAFDNDSQVMELTARKHATGPDMVKVLVERIGEKTTKKRRKAKTNG